MRAWRAGASGGRRAARDGWEIRVDAGPDPVTGGRRQISRSLPTKPEAEAALARLLVEVDGAQQGRTDVTFEALLERWFEMRSPDWSPKTVLEHRRSIDRLVGPALGSITLRKLRSEDLDRFYARLRKSGGQGGKPLKASSVGRVHVVIHSALAHAVKWRWDPLQPDRRGVTGHAREGRYPALVPDGVNRILELATEWVPEFGLFLRLAAVTGARRGALCALRYTDIDVDRPRVTVGRGIVPGPNGVIEKDTKPHLVQRIALDGRTLDLLEDHRRRMPAQADDRRDEPVSRGHPQRLPEPWWLSGASGGR